VAAARRDLVSSSLQSLFSLLGDEARVIAPSGAVYIRVRTLSFLLCGAGVVALLLTNYLLDNLTSGEFTNLFTHLVTIRLAVYFALGLECLFWYQHAVNDIKRAARELQQQQEH